MQLAFDKKAAEQSNPYLRNVGIEHDDYLRSWVVVYELWLF
jgi:hypothetical protein